MFSLVSIHSNYNWHPCNILYDKYLRKKFLIGSSFFNAQKPMYVGVYTIVVMFWMIFWSNEFFFSQNVTKYSYISIYWQKMKNYFSDSLNNILTLSPPNCTSNTLPFIFVQSYFFGFLTCQFCFWLKIHKASQWRRG